MEVWPQQPCNLIKLPTFSWVQSVHFTADRLWVFLATFWRHFGFLCQSQTDRILTVNIPTFHLQPAMVAPFWLFVDFMTQLKDKYAKCKHFNVQWMQPTNEHMTSTQPSNKQIVERFMSTSSVYIWISTQTRTFSKMKEKEFG